MGRGLTRVDFLHLMPKFVAVILKSGDAEAYSAYPTDLFGIGIKKSLLN
jgi:hypothetical protein